MIIDCDTHFMPRDAFDRVPGALNALRPHLQFDAKGEYTGLDFPGRPAHVPGSTPLSAPGTGSNYLGMCDMEARVKDYADLGIERTCVLAQFSGWWSYLIEPELGTAMAHAWNLAVLELQKKYPRHVAGIALIALQDPDAAIKEMAWARDNGFAGVAIDKVFPVRTHCYSEGLGSQRQLWPFFRAAANLDMPIYLHAVQHGHRLSNNVWFQKDGLDLFAPNEGQMSLVSLFTSGLLDEYPGLKFVYTEAGTAFIQPLVERLDKSFGTAVVDYDNEDATPFFRGRGPAHGDQNLQRARALEPLEVYLEKNRKPARHYFRNNFFFTIETEEPQLPDAIEFIGADRFLFATDYPHDDPGGAMKFRDVKLLDKNERIKPADKERLRSENACEFLGLG
jgi:predicted TIM-barrel fold metal-dependent hydrolase